MALGFMVAFGIAAAVGLQPQVERPVVPAVHPVPELWFYCPANFLVDETPARLESLFARAEKAGYRKALITDYKFGFLQDMPARYFTNVDRVKASAAAHRIEIVPGVFPIGWSDSILYNDPNLAEGFPVEGALFVVQGGGGEARLVADPATGLRGGDMSDLGQWDWHDATVVADAGTARVTDPRGQNARIVQKVKVAPYRQYHISVSCRTEDFAGTPEVKILANQDGYKSLAFSDLGVQRTQGRTPHHTVFNALGNTEVTVYLGVWDGTTGSLWWDDAVLEEVGLLNLLRRPGAPLTVEIEGGRTLVEGTDFAPLVDPRMGTVPWPGSYELWHEPPTIRTLGPLPDGTRLRVSYFHPMIIYSGSVMICPSEPKTDDVLRDHFVRVHGAFGARGYFMSHDEIRSMNRCAACTGRGIDAGPMLAGNAGACAGLARAAAPGARLYIWSDMFDPFHNAHADYYLVRGDLAGSWEGLDREIVVANWNFGERDKSLRFFAGRGHKQIIAGYYDGPVSDIERWLDSARGVPGVIGVMYTTWAGDYSKLEEFAAAVRSHR